MIDDDTHTNALICEALKLENFDTVQAHSGEQALEILKSEQVDLILLDMILPGLKGWQVADELKKNPATANIPIMLMSILPPEDTNVHQTNASVTAYICKPFDMDNLTQEVRRVSSGKL